MIFYAMLGKGMLWTKAQDSDANYAKYTKKRETGYPPFEMQDPDPKRILYLLMDPNPKGRPEASQLLEDIWIKSISMCRNSIEDSPVSPDSIRHTNSSESHIHLTCIPPLNHH